MGLRVKEDGESEGRPVMGRIGVAPSGNITPRESGQTSIRSFLTREPELPTPETKQMTAVETQAGAVSHEPIDWTTIDWQNSQSERASAPGAYREGDTGGQME